MKMILTLPAPHEAQTIRSMLGEPGIDEVRFNVGARSPYPPRDTLERLLDLCGARPLWIDLKGRQLRIVEWAVPTYGDVRLNHRVSVDLPAQLVFRDGDVSTIQVVKGDRVYVEPPPRRSVGAGQAVNIIGEHLIIDEYLTGEDEAYLWAARDLGLKRFMLSFVESASDIESVRAVVPEAELILKIESQRGLEYVCREFVGADPRLRLMAARDDLWINIGADKTAMLEALGLILERDPGAVVASRFLTSLEDPARLDPSLGELSDLRLMQLMGFRAFMLSDGVSRTGYRSALRFWQAFVRRYGSAA